MTSQASDILVKDNILFSLLRTTGPIFEPTRHGIATKPLSTAHTKGFVCSYSISNFALRLDDLAIRPREKEAATKTVLLFGSPLVDEDGDLTYRKMGWAPQFTGSILIGTAAIDALKMPYAMHDHWRYELSIEIEVESDQVVAEYNHSEEIERLRQFERPKRLDARFRSIADMVLVDSRLRSWSGRVKKGEPSK